MLFFTLNIYKGVCSLKYRTNHWIINSYKLNHVVVKYVKGYRIAFHVYVMSCECVCVCVWMQAYVYILLSMLILSSTVGSKNQYTQAELKMWKLILIINKENYNSSVVKLTIFSWPLKFVETLKILLDVYKCIRKWKLAKLILNIL